MAFSLICRTRLRVRLNFFSPILPGKLKFAYCYPIRQLYTVKKSTPRTVLFYKDYFLEFYAEQNPIVQRKIDWTIGLVRDLTHIPEKYFKHLEGTDGLFELRVKAGSNIFRIFCFFDEGNLVILLNGFQKKTNKIPRQELDRAEQIQRDYYHEKYNNV